MQSSTCSFSLSLSPSLYVDDKLLFNPSRRVNVSFLLLVRLISTVMDTLVSMVFFGHFEIEKSFIIPTTLFDEQAMNNKNPFSFSGHSSSMNFNLNGNYYLTTFFRYSNQKVNLWFIF